MIACNFPQVKKNECAQSIVCDVQEANINAGVKTFGLGLVFVHKYQQRRDMCICVKSTLLAQTQTNYVIYYIMPLILLECVNALYTYTYKYICIHIVHISYIFHSNAI